MNKKAILIGNKLFPRDDSIPDLRYTLNDVRALSELLLQPNRGGFVHVEVHEDEESYNVRVALNELLHSASSADFILIYYSGHGLLNMNGKLGLATYDSTFKALEATSLMTDELRSFIDSSKAGRILLILDCCFSGRAGDSFARDVVENRLTMLTEGKGIYILTASTRMQAAVEKEKDQHGLFTRHILEGIRTGKADLDGDGQITIDELYEYLVKSMGEECRQRPMKWGLGVEGTIAIASSDIKSRPVSTDSTSNPTTVKPENRTVPEAALTLSKRKTKILIYSVLGVVFSHIVWVLMYVIYPKFPESVDDSGIMDPIITIIYMNLLGAGLALLSGTILLILSHRARFKAGIKLGWCSALMPVSQAAIIVLTILGWFIFPPISVLGYVLLVIAYPVYWVVILSFVIIALIRFKKLIKLNRQKEKMQDLT